MIGPARSYHVAQLADGRPKQVGGTAKCSTLVTLVSIDRYTRVWGTTSNSQEAPMSRHRAPTIESATGVSLTMPSSILF
jgi:hypothetical protein